MQMLTYQNRKFYLDGREFVIHSGSLHYFRALPAYWESLMRKYRAAGLNCVETYIAWNLHEPRKGEYCFEGIADLEQFIRTAAKVGLYVMLRPGPFICAEWENGALPSWLFRDPTMRMRCLEEPYITHLKDWYRVLLAKIKPHLHGNGGPVIAVALENEYGSFGDDFDYLSQVEAIYREAGLDCFFFSADGDARAYLCTGSHDHVLKGLDFGIGKTDMPGKFALLTDRYLDGQGPRLIAEYWGGNFTHWGDEKWYECDDELFRENLSQIIENGISYNHYMFFGGTNFGFMSGANLVTNGSSSAVPGRDSVFRPDTTSYDYDAPLTEWGDYTERYFITRELLGKTAQEPLPPVPPAPEYQTIGQVKLTASASLFDNMHLARTQKSKTVECMEYYGQDYGYIRYRKVMSYDAPRDAIQIEGLRDRAWVYLNGELLGIRMRTQDESAVKLPDGLKKGDVIDIFVENCGRVNFGTLTYRGDCKGIIGGVYLSNRAAFDWEVSCFDMKDISGVSYREGTQAGLPAFFRGTFAAQPGRECFVHMENFRKGIVFVNGFNLGRYWEIGPQDALYLPGALLKETNEIVVFETDGLRGEPAVTITAEHGLRGKTHNPVAGL